MTRQIPVPFTLVALENRVRVLEARLAELTRELDTLTVEIENRPERVRPTVRAHEPVVRGGAL